MIELFVEMMLNEKPYTDRVMFCTWGGDILERQSTKKQECEPMTFPTLKECEGDAFWYGTIATANALQKAPSFFLGEYSDKLKDGVNRQRGPLKFICSSKERVS